MANPDLVGEVAPMPSGQSGGIALAADEHGEAWPLLLVVRPEGGRVVDVVQLAERQRAVTAIDDRVVLRVRVRIADKKRVDGAAEQFVPGRNRISHERRQSEAFLPTWSAVLLVLLAGQAPPGWEKILTAPRAP